MELTNNRLLLALSPLPLLILLVISFEAGAGYVNSDKARVSQFQSKAELFEHLKNQRDKEQSKLAQKYKDEIIKKFPDFNINYFLEKNGKKLLIIEQEEY